MNDATPVFRAARVRIPSLAGIVLWLAFLTFLPTPARAAGGVYVANNGSADLSQYSIGIGGGLSALSPATVASCS